MLLQAQKPLTHSRRLARQRQHVVRSSFQRERASPPPRDPSFTTDGLPNLSGRALVKSLLVQGHSFYAPSPSMSQAVEEMISMGPRPDLNYIEQFGQGTWQVFHAPHISGMSQVMMTKFDPILYKFGPGNTIVSNVKYTAPVVNSGWLSSSGTMFRKDDSSVEINFDKFWIDMGDQLRPELDGQISSGLDVDAVVGALGKAAFFPQFAVFPVLYFDEELAVFEFPPLKSKIAIRRVEGGAALPPAW